MTGASNEAIGQELRIGVMTVETYRYRLMRKLGTKSVCSLICKCWGLCDVDSSFRRSLDLALSVTEPAVQGRYPFAEVGQLSAR